MSRRLLNIDMDGVLADFEGGFAKLFDRAHDSIPDPEMWAMIDDCPEFFASLDPLPGAVEFFNDYAHLEPVILTACPEKHYARVAGQKIGWIRKHICEDVMVLPVRGGRNKVLFMQHPGDVLIDDHARNIDQWTLGGGIGVLHRGDFTPARDEIVKLDDWW